MQIRRKVLLNEDSASGYLTTHTGWHRHYSMQLNSNSSDLQTVRTNEQMMQSMKGATQILGSMNRSMNLPALQRIAMEFERENDIMDQRQEMMDDAIDDATGIDDEAEGDEVVEQVLEEIGVDLRQAVSFPYQRLTKKTSLIPNYRWERHRRAYRPAL